MNTNRGTVFYVLTKHQEEEENENDDGQQVNAEILALDELIPNTKPLFLTEAETQPYLIDAFMSSDLFKEIKNV